MRNQRVKDDLALAAAFGVRQRQAPYAYRYLASVKR